MATVSKIFKCNGADIPSRARQRGQFPMLTARLGLKLLPQRSQLNISPPVLDTTMPECPPGPEVRID
jgi:hypothetical protein